jgi:hypothetical protein
MLYPIWLFLSAIFFYFAFVHWRESRISIRPFRHREHAGQAGKAAGAERLLRDFVEDFNRYLEVVNTQNKSRNLAAAGGYFVAGLVSLISMFFVLGSL